MGLRMPRVADAKPAKSNTTGITLKAWYRIVETVCRTCVSMCEKDWKT